MRLRSKRNLWVRSKAKELGLSPARLVIAI
jgi:hypothetical protein